MKEKTIFEEVESFKSYKKEVQEDFKSKENKLYLKLGKMFFKYMEYFTENEFIEFVENKKNEKIKIEKIENTENEKIENTENENIENEKIYGSLIDNQ